MDYERRPGNLRELRTIWRGKTYLNSADKAELALIPPVEEIGEVEWDRRCNVVFDHCRSRRQRGDLLTNIGALMTTLTALLALIAFVAYLDGASKWYAVSFAIVCAGSFVAFVKGLNMLSVQ